MNAASLIATERLTKKYGEFVAIDHMDFDLHAGEVHIIFGENGAGKSTFISMLSGATAPSAGRIFFRGEEISLKSVTDAQRQGVYTVFQELSLVPNLTVAQNIFLGDEPHVLGAISYRTMAAETRKLLERLEFDISPHARLADLSRASRQMVEITKAVRGDLSVLILDEPTASLSDKEVDSLFALLGILKRRGVGIIYISHRVQEFSRIADRITIVRDGRKIDTLAMADTSSSELVDLMAGRKIDEIYPTIPHRPGEEILKIEGVSISRARPISFAVRAGEVIGAAGLVGSGKSRFFRRIMGLEGQRNGCVRLLGRDVTHASTSEIIRTGMSYLSPDRKTEGLALDHTADFNLAVNLIGPGQGWRAAYFNRKSIERACGRIAERVQLSLGARKKPVSRLSGGNQQKVLFGKAFCQDSAVFIFDEPTVGVDMKTRIALYEMIQSLAMAGKAVVIISSDLPEVLNLSHRILVFAAGQLVSELGRHEANEERVLGLFFGTN